MTDIYTSTGKEILRNGRHFGDIIDDESAEMIVRAMNMRRHECGPESGSNEWLMQSPQFHPGDIA